LPNLVNLLKHFARDFRQLHEQPNFPACFLCLQSLYEVNPAAKLLMLVYVVSVCPGANKKQQ